MQICWLVTPSTPKRTNQSVRRVARPLSTWRPPFIELALFSVLADSLLSPCTPDSRPWRWGSFPFLVSSTQILASLEVNGGNRKCVQRRRVPGESGPRRIAGSNNCYGKFPPASLWRRSLQTPGSRPTYTWRPGEGLASGPGLAEATRSPGSAAGLGSRRAPSGGRPPRGAAVVGAA